ncbi:MAG: hypothetical protein K2K16_00090 [Ruminococcus sp.]|nr:hypothetical protein [Ruminococcus sp.]
MLEIRENLSRENYDFTGDNVHITEAFENNKVTGYIAYSYENDRTVIHGLDDGGDLLLCDGLVRSVIFKSTLKSIGTLVFDTSDCLDNLRKLKFITGENMTVENIDRFMNGCSDCNHRN